MPESVDGAIAVLLDLAQRGEIDPWDVQVIEVIDRYLSKLTLPGNSEPGTQEADLPQSGQAFLWASMLVFLKADTLQKLEEEPEDEDFLEEEIVEVEGKRRLPVRLEKHIRRRPSAPPLRRRRVTLNELIGQIKEIAATLEETPSSSDSGHNRRHSRQEATRIVTQLAHNENLTEVASQLEQFLTFELPQLSPEQSWLNLEQLLNWWSEATSRNDTYHGSKTHDKVGVFWALLLLSAQSKVELSQDEFYQDLRIKPLR